MKVANKTVASKTVASKKVSVNSLIISMALAAVLSPAASAAINMMSDIEYWVGSGSNQSALILQWNDGKSATSYAWGYRWNSGSPTGLDMLQAIALDDPRLSVVAHPSYSTAVYGIYFDANGSGNDFTAGTPGDLGGPEGGTLPDATDRYQEGWFTGFWENYIVGGDFTYEVYDDDFNFIGTADYNVPGTTSYSSDWFANQIGAANRVLIDGSWDAWSYASGFASTAPVQPEAAPIPEPTALLLIVCSLGGLASFRRRKNP